MNFRLLIVIVSFLGYGVLGQVPQLLHFQGRVTVEGVPFNGTGQFKFALVGQGATPVTYWSNDGSSSNGGEPAAAVALPVDKGLYSVLLGDPALANMTRGIAPEVFAQNAVFLRVWFNDGPHGSQLLVPDQRIAAVGYALTAARAETVADGAITSAKLAANAVTSASLANGSVGGAQLAPSLTIPGTLTAGNFAGNGAGLANVAGTFRWQPVTGAAQQAQVNTGYLADNAGPVAITLPVAPALGDTVRVTGVGKGGWRINQHPGQSVALGTLDLAAGAWVSHESNRVWYWVASSADGSKLVAVVRTGKIYTSSDFGATWTPRENGRDWVSVASSADGSKLVAVVFGGPIFTSTDFGANWTQRETIRFWYSVASSADGAKLAAVENSGKIYTSTDSGVTWTPRESNRPWYCIASSSDGSKLVAGVNNGHLYTSADSGVTWTPRESVRRWFSVAASADGAKLVAAAANGQIYTSADSGATWAPHELNRSWTAVTSSADGTKLAAVVTGGQIFTSTDSGFSWSPRELDRAWTSIASSADGTRLAATVNLGQIYTTTSVTATTVGISGFLSGNQGSAIELQFIGSGRWQPLTSHGGPFGYN